MQLNIKKLLGLPRRLTLADCSSTLVQVSSLTGQLLETVSSEYLLPQQSQHSYPDQAAYERQLN